MGNVLTKFVGVWLRPMQTMQQVKDEGMEAPLGPSIVFITIMGVLAGVVTAVIGQFGPPPSVGGETLPKNFVWLSVLIVPLVSIIGSFLGSGIVWGLITGFLNGTMAQYKTIYRVLALLSAFSPISAAISSVPKVGQYLAIAINLWATIVMIRGIILVLETKPVRTWVTLGIVFGLLFGLGVLARIAADRQFRGLSATAPTDFGANDEEIANGINTAEDEKLDKELEDLAERAKNEAKDEVKPDTKK